MSFQTPTFPESATVRLFTSGWIRLHALICVGYYHRIPTAPFKFLARSRAPPLLLGGCDCPFGSRGYVRIDGTPRKYVGGLYKVGCYGTYQIPESIFIELPR